TPLRPGRRPGRGRLRPRRAAGSPALCWAPCKGMLGGGPGAGAELKEDVLNRGGREHHEGNMTQRRLVVLATVVLVLPIAGRTLRFLTPEPVITEDRARSIQLGMTESEVRAMLGGPPGDYTGGAVVTYSRGGVGADDTGYYEGTNWWGIQGVVQVKFSKD